MAAGPVMSVAWASRSSAGPTETAPGRRDRRSAVLGSPAPAGVSCPGSWPTTRLLGSRWHVPGDRRGSGCRCGWPEPGRPGSSTARTSLAVVLLLTVAAAAGRRLRHRPLRYPTTSTATPGTPTSNSPASIPTATPRRGPAAPLRYPTVTGRRRSMPPHRPGTRAAPSSTGPGPDHLSPRRRGLVRGVHVVTFGASWVATVAARRRPRRRPDHRLSSRLGPRQRTRSAPGRLVRPIPAPCGRARRQRPRRRPRSAASGRGRPGPAP